MKSLIALVLLACNASGEPLRNVPYVAGGHPLQKLDIYLPEGKATKPMPVMIGIHGGGWAIGDKRNPGFVHPKAEWFHDQGFIMVSINYRLSPEVTHPSHIEDVCSAIAWVEDNIAKYGGDPTRLYLLGHSAGAHLAALAAVDDSRLKHAGINASSIRGAILIDGAAYHVPKQIEDRAFRIADNVYTRAFTNDVRIQEDASPALEVAGSKRTPPPFLILYVDGRQSAKTQSEELAVALRHRGGTAVVVAVEGKNHITINRDLGKPGDPTTRAVEEFLGD